MSPEFQGPLGGNKPDGGSAVRYFSLARHALVALLRTLGVRAGGRVLLPEYICRDLLASLSAVGACPVFYPVDSQLAPARSFEHWPRADAVLMVDYFGFAQEIDPFEQYCKRTGALLIEDNAHGYLSRDASGQWLGQRGDAGLFSFRKTLLLADGAAYRLNRDTARWQPAVQLGEADSPVPLGISVRRGLRGFPGGRYLAARGASLQRAVRMLRTGHALPLPAEDAERVIPGAPHPHLGLEATLAGYAMEPEIGRRRQLYEALEARVRACGARPVYPRLPAGTVPYGMPVYCNDGLALARVAGAAGLDSFRWPDLPDALAATAPPHYQHLHVINFL